MLQRTKAEMMMIVAHQIARYSPDPFKKVGCVGLDEYGDIVGTGWNHAGKKASQSFWKDREERRPYVIHAEIDLIVSTPYQIDTVIITLFPCVHCMNALAAKGVSEIYYDEIYDKDRKALEVANFHHISLYQIELHTPII